MLLYQNLACTIHGKMSKLVKKIYKKMLKACKICWRSITACFFSCYVFRFQIVVFSFYSREQYVLC